MAHGTDVAHGAHVACGTRASATRHAKPRGRAARAHAVQGGVDAWHGPRESTRMPRWRHVAGGLTSEGPTG